ncbi:MAG: amidohydrolase [Cohaesibacteraceae bacterium]|nr:amidohydrolase [Cohaesibacteraceae bacterium]MBL4876862.1 amidohydrolase [Cohaesibacteraceae bacterium]PCH81390.1 MAG: amidohydrolase [Hyphomicrobiales bacterium]
MSPEVTGWRRWLHQNPELLFDLPKTAKYVAERLREIGVDEIHEGIAQTGMVAIIHGREKGPAIGLRADMDALPMDEESGVEHSSQTPGKMHACGHDGHTAMLLGAAKYLVETRNFAGTAVLIFQPAEEGGGGGDVMVKEGIMDRFDVKEVYGMHNAPGLPLGQFALRKGALLAAADFFDIVVTGKGGHAARPHHCKDPILAATACITGFQSIISRYTDPIENGVLSVTAITSGSTYNVIPPHAHIKGTVRALHEATRQTIADRMQDVCDGVSKMYGMEIELKYKPLYPVTFNHSDNTEFAGDHAASIVGEENVDRDCPPRMGGEDFSFMLLSRPGAMIYLGNGDTAGVHHPAYDFNDDAIPFGVEYWVKTIETRIPAQA